VTQAIEEVKRVLMVESLWRYLARNSNGIWRETQSAARFQYTTRPDDAVWL